MTKYEEKGGTVANITAETGMMLCKWDGSERKVLEGLSCTSQEPYYVKGDCVYWISSDGLFHTYHIPEQREETAEINLIQNGVLVGQKLYGMNGYADLENGTQEKCFVLNSEGDQVIISEMYTDGDFVYALAGVIGMPSRLFRVQLVSAEEASEIIYFKMKEELDRYQQAMLLVPMDTLEQ